MTPSKKNIDPKVEQNKLLIFSVVILLFMVGVAITLNRLEGTRLRSDVYLRWYAAAALLQEGRNIYDPLNAEEVNLIVYGVPQIDMKPGFYYPANLLLFLIPLAWIPYETAHLVWTILGQVFYILGIYAVIRALNWPQRASLITLFLGLCLLYLPALQHTIWGQFNTIGVLSLGLCYLALSRNKFVLAGALITGLTVKPHPYVLTLVFLLLWALFQAWRWRFLLGFISAGIAQWLVTEMLQPGWVFAFFNSLGGYFPTRSVIDWFWNPFQGVTAVLILASLVLFWVNRHKPLESPAFAGSLAISLAVTALVVPIVGMMHTVVMPIPILLLFFYYHKFSSRLFRYAIINFIVIYILGWFVFIFGLSRADLYGQHIIWSEIIYKAVLPLLVIVWSLPLFLGKYRHAEW